MYENNFECNKVVELVHHINKHQKTECVCKNDEIHLVGFAPKDKTSVQKYCYKNSIKTNRI